MKPNKNDLDKKLRGVLHSYADYERIRFEMEINGQMEQSLLNQKWEEFMTVHTAFDKMLSELTAPPPPTVSAPVQAPDGQMYLLYDDGVPITLRVDSRENADYYMGSMSRGKGLGEYRAYLQQVEPKTGFMITENMITKSDKVVISPYTFDAIAAYADAIVDFCHQKGKRNANPLAETLTNLISQIKLEKSRMV